MTDAPGRVSGGVFISYRRVDSSPWALRIADHLAVELGAEQVFVDIDALSPGEDFAAVIDATLRRCPVVLVLIGRQWLTVTSPGGARRIDDPGDLVRIEVTTALERAQVVIPVLVDGARMPVADDLPLPLRALARKPALDLGSTRFDVAMADLQARVHSVLGRPSPPFRQRLARFLGSTEGLVAILLVAAALVWVSARLLIADGGDRPDRPDPAASVEVPDGANDLFLADGELWLRSRDPHELRRISSSDLGVASTVSMREDVDRILVSDGRIWATTTGDELVALSPDTGALEPVAQLEDDVLALAHDVEDGLWLGMQDPSARDDTFGTVTALDRTTGDVTRRIAVGSPPHRIVADGTVLWLVLRHSVARLDLLSAGPGPDATGLTVAGPTTKVDGVAEPVGWDPGDLVLAGDSAWVVDHRTGVLYQLDQTTGGVLHSTRLDVSVSQSASRALVVTDDGLWVAGRGLMLLVDLSTGEPVERVELPGVDRLVVDDDQVWGLYHDGDTQRLERWELDEVREPV